MLDQSSLLIIIVIVAFGAMMWWQSRSAKKRQNQMRDFRESLEPGTEVISIGGVIGKVVSVDTKYQEIVIDSEGSLIRFSFNAISKRYERPAFIDDNESAAASSQTSSDDETSDGQRSVEDASDHDATLSAEDPTRVSNADGAQIPLHNTETIDNTETVGTDDVDEASDGSDESGSTAGDLSSDQVEPQSTSSTR